MTTVFVTGSAGFIGYHLCNLLLDQGYLVHGYDGMTPYYDTQLKRDRHAILKQKVGFSVTEAMLENDLVLNQTMAAFQPSIVIHLAAQAGVRYSLENPRAYIDANLVGTFNVMEAVKKHAVKHFMLASTSSVYGGNTKMPFHENDPTDTQLTLYAATKKSCEVMAHSYASLWKIPTTIFRFFSVYGSWGRPDMALFKFTEAILAGRPIDLYNNGEMTRDFTHVSDLVKAISLLAKTVQPDFSSPHYRIVNIGNAQPVALLDFVAVLEKVLGKKSIRNLLPMQAGDVKATWADTNKLKFLTGFQPATNIADGIADFVDWHVSYYAGRHIKTGT